MGDPLRDADAELRERLERLERTLDRVSARDEEPEENRSSAKKADRAFLLALLGGFATLMVPLTTLIHGMLESDRLAMTAEHQIVASHLEDALKADISDFQHFRHLRFLRELEPAGGRAPSNLVEILGAWSETEYQHYFRVADQEARLLAEEINDQRAALVRLRGKLEEDRGWIEQQRLRWTIEGHSYQEFGPAFERIKKINGARSKSVKDAQKRLDALEERWQVVQTAFGLDDDKTLEYVVHDDSIEFMRLECLQSPRDECTTYGELLHYEATRAVARGDHEQRRLFHEANMAFDRACSRGQMYACALLGRSHRLGEGLKQNLPLAADYLERACDGGDPQGCNGLGWRYFKGEGRPKDEQRAKELFEQSCNLRWLNGCDSLGTWYQRKEQLAEAKEKFKEACNGNEIRACANLVNLKLNEPADDFNASTPVPSSESLPGRSEGGDDGAAAGTPG